MNDCIFCAIIARQIPGVIVAENDDVVVIQDKYPQAPIHYLIVPKKHVKDIASLDSQDLNLGKATFAMAQQLSSSTPGAQDFRLVINNGYNAGQRVFHLHTHFLAGHGSDERLVS